LGRYWARWSDALQESGFEPNQFQTAANEQVLIEKFIALMRELRKFPTDSEVKLNTREAAGFPSHNTFARFGSRQQLAARLQEYCRQREGYHDVIELCAARAGSAGKTSTRDNSGNQGNFGFVYLMKSNRYYKIGKTNHLGGRERDLSIQLPDKIKTVHSIRTDDPAGIEAYWHNRFAAKRKNGEWFELTVDDVGAFKRRKFM
jgi:hypothetical protein